MPQKKNETKRKKNKAMENARNLEIATKKRNMQIKIDKNKKNTANERKQKTHSEIKTVSV